MIKTVSILGSTGSVGVTTLKILDNSNNRLKIKLLYANKNLKEICYQIKKYKPEFFVINDLKVFKKVNKMKFKNKIKILNNLTKAKFKKKIDISISAIPGFAGLEPTLSIIKFSKKLLIANKESVICGWNLLKKKASQHRSKIIPIDSEHFSIMKLLENHSVKEIKKIYLTASGGPFLNSSYSKLRSIKPKDALKHPKWKMGRKISIDSATLMNKIFELIEAQKLFNIPKDKLDILIHPESLVHAIIVLKNGLTKFIYHETSMTIPLANAIFEKNLNIENFYKDKNLHYKKNIIKNLTFQKVNVKNFEAIRLIKRLNEYPSTPIIVNAANEILVDQFLQKNIPFLSISKIILSILNDKKYKKYAIKTPKNIKDIQKINDWTKEATLKKIK